MTELQNGKDGRYDSAPAHVRDGDVIIVGAGLAGLFTALKLAPMPVTVVSAAPIGDGASSAWAQGGIAAAVGEGDAPRAHAEDTLAAGADLVDPAIAHLTANEAPGRIDDLLRYGVPFDRDLEGKLSLSREAAHSARRIVRVEGDGAGRAIMAALIASVRNTPSIRVIENVEARELIVADDQVVGVRIWPVGNEGPAASEDLMARAVVLTTGGIGHLFAVTTNPVQARGEGLAMAARAGAVIADPEFVQFHPTAINAGLDPAPLATEALRGDGATLVNRHGDRFMVPLHDEAELAPRDIVARAVHRENVSGRGAFLDCREAVGQEFPEKFPTVYTMCKKAGIDPVADTIPVAPAAHYHMGGVMTDARGRTSVDGLWACGEVAATGLHGANRLASNSLIEAVVFGARIAEDISGHVRIRTHGEILPSIVRENANTASATHRTANVVASLRDAMSRHAGVLRTHDGLAGTLDLIVHLERQTGHDLSTRNMLLAARFVVTGALARTESRGGHFRTDFPVASQHGAHRTFLRMRDLDRAATDARTEVVSTDNVVAFKA
ncbi:MAG: L-aspartate oxidase [Hyphomicrobiaceae bacterium]